MARIPPAADAAVAPEARRELDRQLRDPALTYLRQGAAEQPERKAYLEGLLAFYGEQYPAAIRKAILAAAPGAIEIGDRAEAIKAAVSELKHGDVLLVAGKGHESGQIVGERTLPFSDQAAVRAALGDSV